MPSLPPACCYRGCRIATLLAGLCACGEPPVAIVSGVNVVDVAVDDAYVYWIDFTSGDYGIRAYALRAVPRTGGPGALLDELPQDSSLVQREGVPYLISEDDSAWQLFRLGGVASPPEVVARDVQTEPQAWTVLGGEVYEIYYTGSVWHYTGISSEEQIARVPCSEDVPYGYCGGLLALAGAGRQLYAIDGYAGILYRVSLDDGQVSEVLRSEALHGDVAWAYELTISGDVLHWIGGDSVWRYALGDAAPARMSPEEGAAPELARGLQAAGDLVFWLARFEDHDAVVLSATDATTFRVCAEIERGSNSLAVDPSGVYVAEMVNDRIIQVCEDELQR